MKIIIAIHILITILSMIMSKSTIISIGDEKFYKLINSYMGNNIESPQIIIGYTYGVNRKETCVNIILIGKENKKIRFKANREHEIALYIGFHSNLKKYIIIYNLIIIILSFIIILIYKIYNK